MVPKVGFRNSSLLLSAMAIQTDLFYLHNLDLCERLKFMFESKFLTELPSGPLPLHTRGPYLMTMVLRVSS
jgi:hypothetical protein